MHKRMAFIDYTRYCAARHDCDCSHAPPQRQKVFLFQIRHMKQDIILLHGLFGELSNWDSVVEEFSVSYNLHVPALPLYETASKDPLEFFVAFLEQFITDNNLKDVILVGNSLGGHVAVLYTSSLQQC